jgi:hypothetical protein
VLFRQVSRSLSAAPFKVTKAKKSFDEVEPSVEFEGRLDTYRYVNVKAIKNKLWTPQRDVMMRIWVEDGSGTARGLYDYLVVCDTTNNTATRIDNNELWIDVALKPAKAVEFIYVPIRVVSTSASI